MGMFSTLRKYLVVLSVLFILAFCCPYIVAAEEEWAYFYVEQYVVRPGETVPFRFQGYLYSPKEIYVYYTPFTDIDQTAKVFDGMDQSNRQLYQTFTANAYKRADSYWTFNYTFKTDKPGYYQLETVLSNGESVKRAITVTDVGIITKHSSKGLVISTVDLTTGELLSGVDVLLRYEKLVLYRLRTDETGSVEIAEVLPNYLNIIAYSPWGCAQVSSSNWYDDEDTLMYIYTDRPIYRPGHTVYFKGILRDREEDGFNPVTALPITIQVRDYDWNIIYQTDYKPNEWGSISGEFQLPLNAMSGSYTIISILGGKSEYYYFTVSSYEKPEYTVSLTTDKDVYAVGDTIMVNLKAEYFFGTPVKEAKVEYTVFATDYGTSAYYYGELIDQGESQTNSEGDCFIPISTVSSTTRRVYRVETAVTDNAGKVIQGNTYVVVYPSVISLKIKQSRYITRTQQPIDFKINSADIYGKKLSLDLSLTVYKEYWEDKKIYRQPISATSISTDQNGEAVYQFPPTEQGYYVVEISCMDEKGFLVTSEAWLWVVDDSFSYWVGPQGGIEILVDKDEYEPGDIAQVLINLGLEKGPVLVSVEGTDLYYWEWFTLDSGASVIEIPIEEKYLPNVWISAVAVRGRSYFQASQVIEVYSPEPFLQVKVTPDKLQYLPGEEARFSFEVLDHLNQGVQTELSFGLVDEAIYALMEESAQPIEDFFYGNQYRQVLTRYSFPRGYLAGAGKDDMPDIEVRDEFKDTALWIPNIYTDSVGKAQVSFTLPDNLTSWRATVRAHSLETQVGQTTQNVTVNKPLIVRLGAPRFLVSGDTAELIMVVSNQTDQPHQVTSGLKISGLEWLEGKGGNAVIPPGGSIQYKYVLKATEPGEARLTPWAVEEGTDEPLSDAAEFIIPIHNRGEEFSSFWTGRLSSARTGDKSDISFNIPEEVKPEHTEIMISLQSSLVASLFEAVDYLTRYPWGCAEQVTSGFLADIILTDAVETVGLARPESLLDSDIVTQSGLLQIYSMQNWDGSWGWWRGDDPSVYISGYVMYGLHQARLRGYPINYDTFSRGLSALKNMMTKARGDELGYLAYILAHIEGDPKLLPILLELKQQREELSWYVQSLLVLALEEIGAKEQSWDLLQDLIADFGVTEDQKQWPLRRWNTYDIKKEFWIRNGIDTAAAILEAYLRLDPSNIHVTQIVQALLGQRSGLYWFSTKETASVLAAFAGYLKNYPDEIIKADGTVLIDLNGLKVEEHHLDSKVDDIWQLRLTEGITEGDNNLSLARTGEGPVYYHIEMQGFQEVPWVLAADQGIKMKREYRRVQYLGMEKYGSPIYSTSPLIGKVHQGELIRVVLQITSDNQLEYLMVEDPIPAGFSVISKSIKSNYWTHWEVLDDRVVFFVTSVPKGKLYIEYDLRAERLGEYWSRQAKASLMYDSDIRGNSAEAKLIIVE
jgi:uncharacterized protein YfaS (alpha-2-macroglobulin family)